MFGRAKKNKPAGLETLAPPGSILILGDTSIEIMPAQLQDLAAMMRELKPLINDLAGGQENPNAKLFITDLFADHAQRMLRAAAIACHRSEDWVLSLSTAHQLDLLVKLFEVNIDFFIQRLRPLITILEEQLVVRATAGQN